MFTSKTVFIVGAGASSEVGLPVGRELTSRISKLLNLHIDWEQVKSGDAQIYETLKQLIHREPDKWHGNRLIASARHIGEAMELATSIDTFLESFSGDHERITLGKLGIAKAILLAERSSSLAPAKQGTQPFAIKTVADTWYVSLAQQLFSGVPVKHVAAAFDNVSFIDFNYDRCIPTFLIRALQTYFELSVGSAEEIVRRVAVVHPYGSLGEIFTSSRDRVCFGDTNVDLASVASRIDTFSETARDAATLHTIRRRVDEAETLVFLGFGFHPQNLDVLTSPESSVRNAGRKARVLATTKGLSNSDSTIVQSMLSNLIWNQPPSGLIEKSIHTFDGSCAQLFGEYWRSITAPVH
jgi:hypothetical protein